MGVELAKRKFGKKTAGKSDPKEKATWGKGKEIRIWYMQWVPPEKTRKNSAAPNAEESALDIKRR